ncbi:MAG: immune inhibitor A domain-containing protein [Candidatus Eisenbacteria bacterium]
MNLHKRHRYGLMGALLLLILPAITYAGEILRLEGYGARDRTPAEGAPVLRRFPHVIGGGELRPIVPSFRRTYEDLLKSTAPAEPETVRVAVFRIEFENDTAGDATTGEGRFLTGEDDGTWFVDAPPHDSTYFHTHLETLRRYYEAQSYGRLRIEWEIFPKSKDAGEYRLSDSQDYLPEGDPADWDLEVRVDGLIRLCTDALKLVDTVDAAVHFSEFDGYMIIHAGPDLQTDVGGDSPGDTPSFFLAYGDEDTVWVDRDAGDPHLIRGTTMIPEYTAQDGFVFGLNGVIAHEFGHQLGLPDLYNTNYSWPAIGVWGLMDSGGMVSIDAGDIYLGSVIPASLCAWSKLYLGWASPEIVTETEDLSLACATLLENPEKLPRYALIPVNDQEYFILENRCGLAEEGEFAAKLDTVNRVILGPVRNDDTEAFTFDYDYALPGWGVLVWHVNNRHLTPERIVYFNDVNNDYNDRAVEVKEADGIKDLGNPYSAYWDGSPHDPFYEGNATLFGPNSWPNSDLRDGGRSRVTVKEIGVPGKTMSLRVEVDRNLAGFPLPMLPDSSAVEPVGIVRARASGAPVAAFWSVSDSTDIRYGVTLAARASDSLDVVRAFFPGSAQGPPLAGDLYGDPEEEIYGIAGGSVYRIDRESEGLLVDLGKLRGDSVLAGPLLLDSDGKGREEIVLFDEYGLVAYGVDRDSIRSPRVISIGDRPASNLAADPDLRSLYYVATDGVFVGFGLGAGKGAARAGLRAAAGGGALASLLTADFDGDGTREIAVVLEDGFVFLFRPDAEVVEGWPVDIGRAPTGEPFVCDRNGDGFLELAIPAGEELVLLDRNGLIATDTPYSIPPYLRRGVPLVGNGIAGRGVTGDDVWPVIADGGGRLWRWNGWEEIAEGWPISTGTRNGAIVAGPGPAGTGAAAYALSADGFLYAYDLDGFDPDRLLWSGPGGGSAMRYAASDDAAAEPLPAGNGEAMITSAFCYPNPVRQGRALLRYALSSDAAVTIEVHDGAGGRAKSLAGAPGRRGENEVTMDTSDLASGVYVVRIEAGTDVTFVKVAVLK